MAYDLTIHEAAQLLGITDQAVHKRIAKETLKATKINKRWMVDRESVQSALASPPPLGRPRTGQTYLLMNGPYEVMEFTYRQESGVFEPLNVLDAARAPLGTISRNGRGKATGLQNWWQHRSIPESRSGLDARLKELGLSNPAHIPFRNLGLSLSDQYWIRPAQEKLAWKDVNYFQNDFDSNEQKWDEWLSNVGLSSPDNTSEGVLSKRWVCRETDRILLKGHVPWTDQQVYNEAVATLLYSKVLNADDYVPYSVMHIDNLGAVSQCACFIQADEEYVPFSLIMDSEGKRAGETTYDNVVRLCSNLGISRPTIERFLAKMIVCDSIMANTDRHLRNFGLIRNIHDLSWRFAPLFDTGNSLWYDKDEAAVARNDHTFISRPFDGSPHKQLQYASDMSWFDITALDGFAEEACEILENGNLSRWRLDYLHDGIQKRIAAVRDICN